MNNSLRNSLAALLLATVSTGAFAEQNKVISPDGRLVVNVEDHAGCLYYDVTYDGKQMMQPSLLGVVANVGDFSQNLVYKSVDKRKVENSYTMRSTKASLVHYKANEMSLTYINDKKLPVVVKFRVSDNDIAFRYEFGEVNDRTHILIDQEKTAFRLPSQTTTFLSPQSDPMIGWKRSKPSYEEEYTPDAPLTAKSKYGKGYTFPCLFHVGNDGWVLVSETGTHGNYPGCRLSDYSVDKGYTVEFPMQGECDGRGASNAAFALPGATPWRTITVGSSLKPIVETTVSYDVVEPLYEASEQYKPGRYIWSWLIWQDNSANYDDQKQMVDLAATMGYEYVLVDGLWDQQTGRERIAELSRYAQSKGVSLMLWYNSNGTANEAPQTPRNCMNTVIARKKEMRWMQSIGVKGIKVDFFGGDKQHVMQLYEDILSDANDYGLQVIFHGCTLPRGWERMFPNYVSSEAVLASENVFFQEHHAKQEGFELTMHPFCRNTVAAMDWGGTIMNRYMSRDNKSRHRRYTSDVFEMAAAIVNQASIQCIAMYPNNLSELPQHEIDFLKSVPTTWDETRFVDGYPGKYAVVARRHGDKWYVAALNGTNKPLSLNLSLPMLAGKQVTYHYETADKKSLWPKSDVKTTKVGKDGKLKIVMQPMGGNIVLGEA
ncbi:glycoside hydrolase family 97 catalytic domain-containing protein [uncultured Prevotella sp.]|uniref:glycoside hydrolase family 97 protein n=1 Tax=uncultured Prevotella sp. TaxID=159272 RepID=UPI0027E30462|nr:glycoside hydrolase family 97 catalytic domain-containing protein [uncultured Prevotella sp.]